MKTSKRKKGKEEFQFGELCLLQMNLMNFQYIFTNNIFILFNKKKTQRNISLEWSLFWVGFILTGLNWINLQHSKPNLEITRVEESEKNPVLRYFISCIVYIVTGIV